MKTIREIQEREKDQHQKIVGHLTQSWQWGDFRKETGVGIFRFGEFENSNLKSAFQLFFHQIPHTHFNVGYLPRSPLPSEKILSFIKEIGKKNNCIFIKLEPNIQQTTEGRQQTQKNLRPGKSVLPRHTFFLDLNQNEEEILKGMHEKTRYNIRLAQKQGVKVEEKDDEKSLETFLKFLEETQKRQGFYTHPSSYFRKQWQILKPEGMIHLLLSSYKSQPIAGILLLRFKNQLYYTYGGSSETHREKMPNQLLHWEAIKLGKKLGCQLYDFWGAYLEKPEPSDSWYGIYRFKAGFGGKLVSYVGAYDLVINPFLYQLYQIIDWLRWKFLRLKRKLFGSHL